jgi:hypothetical protein
MPKFKVTVETAIAIVVEAKDKIEAGEKALKQVSAVIEDKYGDAAKWDVNAWSNSTAELGAEAT